MNPQQLQQFNEMMVQVSDLKVKYDSLQAAYDNLNNLFNRMNQIDKFYLNKPLVLRNTQIRIEGVDGLRLGTNSTDLLAVYGTKPTVQQSAIAAPSGGGTVDSQSRTAIATIILVLKTFGITQ